MHLDIISEKKEQQLCHYFCILSGSHRYDLIIAYSEHFYGKAMVTSIQTGKMVLLCSEDIYSEQFWAPQLGIEQEDIGEFQEFFSMTLQGSVYVEQY
ncbi:SAV0927 family protein [Mesobacillus zeae]|uniref:DUF3055 family protein n=1 Tax=Mesobacillus zeae TaxID=1917180 RepID=A0A398BE19_9BACI|nr:SAV0927 family protein [Mesobacillus zeae]RID85826.1 DUF3055 family protein [Mesobacillus zeae]